MSQGQGGSHDSTTKDTPGGGLVVLFQKVATMIRVFEARDVLLKQTTGN